MPNIKNKSGFEFEAQRALLIDETPLWVFWIPTFFWSVIQSVLNHSNFLVAYRWHASFIWKVLAKQSVEVFIAIPFSTCKWSGKVGRALELLIIGVPCKLFAIVKGQRFHPCRQRLELVHNGRADQLAVFIGYLGHHGIPALALGHPSYLYVALSPSQSFWKILPR